MNAYIDFACRGTANNPGPPATEPGAVVPTSDSASSHDALVPTSDGA
ncbi:hypothetical protein BDK89_2076 [Ilumatobacter fluminis]|uniref:Uncharacterized protein n=1 Tax=Ilumatobacter fluminis TaxID=467091 RepID=A0A4R7HZE2_9ACTN|nr:hypothetical protein [Ilumatobacter fluminis]TDT16485.1 hypothetical protein BDK89_2076 [Ilumatobacter fluminis]